MRVDLCLSLLAALALLAGCSGKPETTASKDSSESRKSFPLNWTRLTPEDTSRFGAQPMILDASPPQSITGTPSGSSGELFYGEFRSGTDGQGRVGLALRRMPPPEGENEAEAWQLYIDRDLDGNLAEEAPLSADPQELEGQQKGVRAAVFPSADIALPGGGRYAFYVQVASGKKLVAEARPACGLTATIELSGSNMNTIVYDANANGTFGDMISAVDRMGDAVWIDFNSNGRRDEDETRPLSPRILYGDKVMSLGISQYPASLLAEAVEGISFGTVRRAGADPEEQLTLQLFSLEYGLLPPRTQGYPEGTYSLISYQVTRKTESELWSIAGLWLSRKAELVHVKADRPAEIAFGPPLAASVWFRYGEGSGPIKKAMIIAMLRGAAGENAIIGTEKGFASVGSYSVKTADGKDVGSGEMQSLPSVPGAAGTFWSVPEGLQKGEALTFVISPDLGPFSDGFDSSQPFEFGKPTPIHLVVSQVEPGAQGERVGLRPGDVIVSYDGKTLDNPILDLGRAMQDAIGRTKIDLVVSRNGQMMTFELQPGRIGIQTGLAMP